MTTLLSITPLIPAGPDLDTGVRFFTEEMGFTLIWSGGNMAGVRRGQVEFNLVQNSDKAWAENTSASIGVDDLDALYAEYRNASGQVGPLEVKSWGRREFHMILPSGVCLQFYERAQ
jgi:catechol 2,3-dioxygenase-like lactoylglutathione lyase family enzyme